MSDNFQNSESSLSASGRFGRLSYLGWNMLIMICFMFLGIIFAVILPAFKNSSANFLVYILVGLFVILYIAFIYYTIILTIRRLHDRNQSGWLSLLIIVPLINLFFFIYLSCAKGDEHSNNYGAPRATKGWEKVLGWIYIVLILLAFIFGVLGGIAIPAYQDYLQRSQQIQIEQQQYNGQ
jgi:uncharacterized membrane protein YhaH (DUF805 family)